MYRLFWFALIVSTHSLLTAAYDIPILTYHNIDYKKNRFSVTPEVLRSHLEKLYNAGYATAPLSDVIAKKSYLKKQKVVILRFDDSTKNQFNYIEGKNGKLVVDPKCAVGILLDFYKEHPSFGKHALFAVLPECFGQPKYRKKKLCFLLNQGMEIANHGTEHKMLIEGMPADIDNEFGKAMENFTSILGPLARKKIRYVVTPYGAVPKRKDTRDRLRKFAYKGVTYPQNAILYASISAGYNRIAPSPFSAEFDPYALPAIEIGMTNFDKYLASFQ